MNTREKRRVACRAITMETLSDDDIPSIQLHLQRQHALGSDRFRSAVEAQLARPAGPLKIGRPRKTSTD
jgi:putative transposase